MDKLRALQTFVAIVDRGSLTKAAEATGSSLPAVVRLLAALEQSLGVRLLHRTTRRLSLTDEGREVLDRARRVLAELDEVESGLRAAREIEPAGCLRVTAPVLFGQMHVAPAVTAFLRRHPLVQVNLLLLDRVVNLVEEGIDVGVRIAQLADSSLVALSLGQIRFVVVASPAYLRRQGVPEHPRDLAQANCLRFSDGPDWTFRDGGRRVSVSGRSNFDCNLAAPALEACAAGLGFARVLAYQAVPYLRARRLRIVLADYEPEPRSLSLVYPSARGLAPRTRAFIDFMRDALGGTALI